MTELKQQRTLFGIRLELLLFFLLVATVAFSNGLSDAILSNYFKDVYSMDAQERAFTEFPRELPGILCVFVMSAFSFLGDLRLALMAQILACIGIMVLGIFTPAVAVMYIFLFLYSLGMHLFMPLSDSVGMSLAEPGQVGRRVGQYGSVKTGVTFLAGIFVFVGFRMGWLSFFTETKWVFVISAICFGLSAVVAFFLIRATRHDYNLTTKRKISFLIRKEYRYYYFLTVLHGVQKQIAYVFGSWVLVDLLAKGADVMSLLTMAGSFLSIFFFRFVGKWLDSRGIRFMMYVDALSFIFIYAIYGVVVYGLTNQWFPDSTIAVVMVYTLFVLDRLSMQVGVVKAVYLRSIAISPEDVTAALSTGVSLDHMVAILAAQLSGWIWVTFGPHWVFFFAAFLSLGNLYVAGKIPKKMG